MTFLEGFSPCQVWGNPDIKKVQDMFSVVPALPILLAIFVLGIAISDSGSKYVIRHMRHLSPEIEGMGPKNPCFFVAKRSLLHFRGFMFSFPMLHFDGVSFSFHVPFSVSMLTCCFHN